MSLASQVSALATRVATEIRAVRNEKVSSSDGTVKDIVRLTQAQYDALGTKVATTLYVIVG